jgi:hypothetical protein
MKTYHFSSIEDGRKGGKGKKKTRRRNWGAEKESEDKGNKLIEEREKEDRERQIERERIEEKGEFFFLN